MRGWLRVWRTRQDPVTGDTLTAGEIFSLAAARIFRRWTFLIVFQAGTLIWWFGLTSMADPRWNALASDLAIVVEGAMAIVIFGQVYRDATVLREVRMLTREVREIGIRVEEDTQLLEQLARNHDRLLDAAIQMLERQPVRLDQPPG